MDYQNMTWGEYTKLYARYLHRPVDELVKLAGKLEGKVVFDLCCGGGELAKACLRRKAVHVVAVDASSTIMAHLRGWRDQKPAPRYSRRLRTVIMPMIHFLKWMGGHPPERNFFDWDGHIRNLDGYDMLPETDVVVCRQGVNYWLNKLTVKMLAKAMKPGSVFVFNTFNTRPSTKPTVKQYHHDGANFIETSWRVAKTGVVHHVQVREGMRPHTTSFQWIPRGTLMRLLGPYFKVTEHRRGRTSLYRCVRKRK